MGNNLYTQGFTHCPTGSNSNALTRVSSLGNANSNDILNGTSNNFIIQSFNYGAGVFSNTTGNFD